MIRSIYLCCLIAATGACGLALEPEEILVIASGSDRDSVEIALYYCHKRSIPTKNLAKLPLPRDRADSISRTHYKAFIAVPVRQMLSSQEYAGKIKCIVTVYGVPFKIGARGLLATEEGYLEKLNKTVETKTTRLREIVKNVQMIGAGADDDGLTDYSNKSARSIIAQLNNIFSRTRTRLDKQSDKVKRIRLQNELVSLYRRVYGPVRAVEYARDIPDVTGELDGLRKVQLAERIKLIKQARRQRWDLPKRIEADYFTRLEAVAGLAAMLESLIADIDRIKGVETNASLDSELSMVMFDDYELYRWQPNELKQSVLWVGTKTIMVSRLDGPGKDIVMGLIDKAIAAEKTGLKGNAYFDSRFGDSKGASQYAEYDTSIQKAASIIEDQTDFKVVQEKTGKLFTPKQCPDTALYCGWYSLKKYVDAFDFVPGAVGYHIASFEAVSLRDPKSTQWCPAMLRDGITATLGPVAEPYLHAFPKPEDFFAQFIEGRCLAEAYYRTKPLNSWQMLLIGDPLYKPFKSAD
ncbi:MAG: TIGR03790 family protein [Planctomycetes bacterium]|nr:TIGR03790 family protein [Planctomycetota bacterium]